MIDHNSDVPIYQQIKNDIKGKIISGKLKSGNKIASEIDLMKEYGVSRVTLRNAISELSNEGLLIKKQGKGTYVNKCKLKNKLEHLKSFTETCNAEGLTSKSKTIITDIIIPSDEQKELLQLEEGDKVLYMRRLRYADNEPIMYEDDYFPYNKYAFLIEEALESSLFELLRSRGVEPLTELENGEDVPLSSLEVITATHEQVELLECNLGAPIFYLETVVYDNCLKPIHIGHQYMRGERFKFMMR